jgi:CSLREA domain-containing protein
VGRTLRLALVGALIVVVLTPLPALAVTITVNNNGDTAADDGVCTLREAIVSANTDTASGAMAGECQAGSGTDTIAFNITPDTITPTSALPAIAQAVTIDGTSDPDSTRVTITGGSAGSNANGLTVTPASGTSTIKGLYITGFQGTGGDAGGGHGIYANLPGATSLTVGGTGPNEGNVLSGNAAHGAFLRFGGTYTLRGNIIGLQADGSTVQANGMGGALVQGVNSVTGGTMGVTPGGPCTGACNLISGNTGLGLHPSSGAVVQGNFIGTDVTGLQDRGNTGAGIIETTDNTVMNFGGTTAAARNIISGNDGSGINLGDAGASNDVIQGNFIGVGTDGTTVIGNGVAGVSLEGDRVTVGGTMAGAGNVIAHNGNTGVSLFPGATGHRIVGNEIRDNTGSGIDLLPGSGVTPNDVGDGDAGANNLQNFPVLSSAAAFGGVATVQGTLNSTSSTMFQADLYASDACNAASPNDFGEGQRYLGSTTVGTDGSGNGSLTFTSSGTPPVAPGEVVTTTATDPNGNTSEFSQCLSVIQGPPPPPPPTCPGFGSDARAQLVGTEGPDTLTGTGAAEIVCGLGGKDVLRGGSGNDLVLGGGGNDRLAGQAGKDVLKAQAGKDRLSGGPGRDRCQGGPGLDTAVGCEAGRT